MWWLHWNNRPGLYGAIGRGSSFVSSGVQKRAKLDRVLVCARVSKTGAFVFVDNDAVFSDQVIVFPTGEIENFVILQSAIHGVYAWKHSSQLKADMRYTPTDVYETFPFPSGVLSNSTAFELGEEFHALRARTMREEKIGLTKLYTKYHKRDTTDKEYNTLRDLQVALDLAVLEAYDWRDIDLNHDYHAVSYLPDNDNIRFTISENARQTVLSRLASLNKERHEAENQSNSTAKRVRSVKSTSAEDAIDDLFSAQGGGR